MQLIQEQGKPLRLWQTVSAANIFQLPSINSFYAARNCWQKTLLILGLLLFIFQINATVMYVALTWKFAYFIKTESDRWKRRNFISLMVTTLLVGLPLDFKIVPFFKFKDLILLCLAVNVGGIGLRSGYECYKSRKFIKMSLIAVAALVLIISMVIVALDL